MSVTVPGRSRSSSLVLLVKGRAWRHRLLRAPGMSHVGASLPSLPLSGMLDMNLVASELLLYSLDFQAVIFSAFLRHKPSCSIAGQYFSNHRFPNRTGTFWRIRLSRDVAPHCIGLIPLAGSRPPPYPLGSVHLPLFPFVVSQALPWAFGYYGNSVTIGVAPCR